MAKSPSPFPSPPKGPRKESSTPSKGGQNTRPSKTKETKAKKEEVPRKKMNPYNSGGGFGITPPRNPINAGTSASWSSKNNTNAQRFDRLEKMAGHSGFSQSPVFPQNVMELLRHEKEWTGDRAQEELGRLKHAIENREAAVKTGVAVGEFLDGKATAPAFPSIASIWGSSPSDASAKSIWAPGAENEPRAAWPTAAELKHYGDVRARSAFRLPRHLPPPRSLVVTQAQVVLLINKGMSEVTALSFLGKNMGERMEELGLPWEEREVLTDYLADQEGIVDETKKIVGGVTGVDSAGTSGGGEGRADGRVGLEGETVDEEATEEFDEAELRGIGAWDELLDEIYR